MDGEKEMMHLIKFQHYARKPKNYPPRGLTDKEAELEFTRLKDEPDAICDEDGPCPEFRTQVAINVRKLVINRNVLERSQGYKLSDKDPPPFHS